MPYILLAFLIKDRKTFFASKKKRFAIAFFSYGNSVKKKAINTW